MTGLIIEQTLDDTRLAFQVHSNAAIQSMRVASSKWKSAAPDQSEDVPIRLEFNLKSKQAAAPPEMLRLEISFRTEGTKDGAKSDTKAFSVECVYEVDYLLKEGFQITPEQVTAFKDGNAIFNTWPYFREFLQSAVQRMGFPPPTAPFLRLQPKQVTKGLPNQANDTRPEKPRGKRGHKSVNPETR
jgi:hypothetical protein